MAASAWFGHEPPAGVKDIFDCYALNVTSEREAWCCYYTDFPLTRIRDYQRLDVWLPGIDGVTALAVWKDRVLLQSGYNKHDWTLLQLHRDGRFESLGRVKVVGEDGEVLDSAAAVARGPDIWNLHRGRVYKASVRALAS